MYLNKIELIGYLGQNPERQTIKNTGRTFSVFSLATQSAWKDANEEYQRRVEWHRLVAWNGLGEYAASKLKKGNHVYIEGTLMSNTYEKEVGKGKNKTKLTLTSWQVKAQSIRKLNLTKPRRPRPHPPNPNRARLPFEPRPRIGGTVNRSPYRYVPRRPARS